jgi:hypothetical protein
MKSHDNETKFTAYRYIHLRHVVLHEPMVDHSENLDIVRIRRRLCYVYIRKLNGHH